MSSDKPAMFKSQSAVLLLERLGESVIHKQKVKTFGLKLRDTEHLTLLFNLQQIWLSLVFLINYPINLFHEREDVYIPNDWNAI